MRPAVLAVLLLSLPALATPPEGLCEVKVTGGAEFVYQGKGGRTAVSSDHWYTEEELRKAVETTINALTKDPAKRQARLDKAMKDGGRFMGPLLLNCVSSEGSSAGNLNILPTDTTTREAVPFKPGTYKLVARSAKPNEFRIMFRAKDVMYSLTGPGELVIQRFDAKGIAGTFSFPAKSSPLASKPGTTEHSVTVTGNFDFPCPAPTEMCRAADAP
ncbi:hypothetical protein [Hyalangium sp.]|uniref:hypothetical protein n=1 Tax=Hyalangium sp. TaxID=2028555 RepID=UPI002D2508CA|nr:hypothetical protein [Hyalangium sp.]HYH97749.1 hypothetical protein [Hyalangium sp.]